MTFTISVNFVTEKPVNKQYNNKYDDVNKSIRNLNQRLQFFFKVTKAISEKKQKT